MEYVRKNKRNLSAALLMVCIMSLASCAKTVAVVNNCPPWLEVGTASIEDTETTLRWMYRYETNRQRECQ